MNIELSKWADVHMARKPGSTSYPMWEKTWCVNGQNLLLRLRLCENDSGASIVVLSCLGGYGAIENEWQGVNLGNAHSIKQIADIYAWLERTALAITSFDDMLHIPMRLETPERKQ